MQKNCKAIVFIGMTYPWGVIRHFAILGCELYKACLSNWDFHYASISREADRKSWRVVRESMPDSAILEAKTFRSLVMRIVGLAKEYDQVVVHTGGGWGQTKHFISTLRDLDKNLRKRIHLVATTHAYRIDSKMRVPMSTFQYVLYRLYYDKVIFQCQYAADRFVGGNRLIKIGKGVVVPLGCEPFNKVGLNPPPGIAEKPRLLELLLKDRKFRFVYLAGFRPGKMHVWLINALTTVLKRHPDACLLFCGTGEQNVIDSVNSAIRTNGLESQVLLPGQIARNEVPWLLAHCDCAVVPSRAETFGHNFLEPMFAGLPVLGTRVGIGRDIIKDGETGYGFDLNDPSSVQVAAEKLLTDIAATREMGRRARKLVENDFTHAAVAQQLVKVYSDVLGERK